VPVAILAFTVEDGRITRIDAHSEPARMAARELDAVIAGSGAPQG
jgi:hypothetical protein